MSATPRTPEIMGKFIGVLFVLAVVFMWGRNTADPVETKTEVKVVRVPDTHVVTETVQLPAPDMPAACRDAIRMLNDSTPLNHDVGEKAGKLASLSDDLGIRIAQSEMSKYVKTQKAIADNKLGLDNANVALVKANELIQTKVAECNQALKPAN